MKLEREIVIEYLGEPEKETNTELIWQCPLCHDEGGDNSRNNLKFSKLKGVLHCFADSSHSKKLFRDIIKNQKGVDNVEPGELTYEEKERFHMIFSKSLEILQDEDSFVFKILKEKRGLTWDTAHKLGLGYRFDADVWVIPIFKYNTNPDPRDFDLIGFEYRPTDFSKKIYKEPNSKSALAMVNVYDRLTEILVIVEGFMDAYALFQYLNEIGESRYYHIVTCSNGVDTLIDQISAIDFPKYKQWLLFIDNDEKGRIAAAKIIEKYPFIRDITLSCGCKDFNEHYMKCIKGIH